MNKPREFWLDLATQHGDPCDFVSEGKPNNLVASTNIHVIEKSAYDELKEKYELLLNDRLNQDTIKALMNRNLKYKTKADKLAEALDRIVNASIGWEEMTEAKVHALDVLKEYYGEGE